MRFEVGKKYKRDNTVVEVKFIDDAGDAWGLTDKSLAKCIISTDRAWQEVTDTPDPGEGWRLLEPDEVLQAGDEWCNEFGQWIASLQSGHRQLSSRHYRRRIAPQYVPYTWEDREELRGRWYRQKDYPEHERLVAHLEISRNEIEINGWGAQKFLQKCEWLDGTPCGKVVE